jgi:glycerol-3-phosphate cytidylyltransferase
LVQSVVDRYIHLKGCKYVDEIVPNATEQDLEDVLKSFKIDAIIIGDDYVSKQFTGRQYCEERGIAWYFNKREHRFSSSELRREVQTEEDLKDK